MTLDEFITKANAMGCLLSNMYQTDDGTWFVALRTYKPEWCVFYGRDKDRERCMITALRAAKRGIPNWPVDPNEVRGRLLGTEVGAKPPKVKSKIKRVRI